VYHKNSLAEKRQTRIVIYVQASPVELRYYNENQKCWHV